MNDSRSKTNGPQCKNTCWWLLNNSVCARNKIDNSALDYSGKKLRPNQMHVYQLKEKIG